MTDKAEDLKNALGQNVHLSGGLELKFICFFYYCCLETSILQRQQIDQPRLL